MKMMVLNKSSQVIQRYCRLNIGQICFNYFEAGFRLKVYNYTFISKQAVYFYLITNFNIIYILYSEMELDLFSCKYHNIPQRQLIIKTNPSV